MTQIPTKIEQIPTASLRPFERNARTHSDAQVDQIAASIREFGWTNPVLIDRTQTIIAGHGRVLAAQRLGIAAVPCIRLEHLTPAQVRAYVIADNKLALNAGWDETLLAAELQAIEASGFDVGLVGFTDAELEALLHPASGDGESDVDAEAQVDRAAELQAKWKTERGQVWTLGIHRIMCGDSRSEADVSSLLEGAKPDLMVTDPPYGVNYDPTWRVKAGVVDKATLKMGLVENDDIADWSPAWRLFPGDVAYVYHAAVHTSVVQGSLEAVGFKVRAQIIWAKDRMALSRGDYHWQHEPCWYAVREGRPGLRNDDRTQTTLWEIPARDDAGHGHGTQKPVECMARPIRNHECHSVFEPFSGSGTTIIACERLGKPCYAMEISPGYVAVALQRWSDATGKTPVLA